MPQATPLRNFRPWETPHVLHRQVHITTTGSAGSATGSAFIPLPAGVVRAVKLNYSASAPATTDLTLKADSSTGTALLTNTNSNTDLAIRALASPSGLDEGGAAAAATDARDGGGFYKYGLHLALAQCDALTDAVIADIWVDVLRFETLTLRPTGSAGSAAANTTLRANGAGVLRALQIDYGSGVPATADITIKNDSSSGDTIFARTNSTTDVGPVGVATIGVDEAGGALDVSTAADMAVGGQPFRTGIYAAVAQADPYVDSTDQILIYLWIEQ